MRPAGTSFAYYVTANALEARAGLRGIDRFALSVWHSLRGHVPFSRCVIASEARRREGSGAGVIERGVADWLESDLNPVVQAVRCVDSVAKVVAGYNAYNRAAPLAIQTNVTIGAHRTAARRLVGIQDDVEGSRIAALAILDRLSACAVENEKLEAPAPLKRPSDVARYLAVEHCAAAHASVVLEACGTMSLPALAAALGCSARTLQRRLREEGFSVQMLQASVRMVRATQRLLDSRVTLTQIAHEEGFSDQAHMSRSFRDSCGVSPSLLRAIITGTA